jgi:ParB-like chromosome segregation protein Spo0J
MEEIRVKIKGLVNLKLEQLNEFQEDIKELLEPDYQAFKAAILAEGFDFSPAVFQDGDDQWWLLDGHQRKRTLQLMEAEGYRIPLIPCVETEADDLDHARRMVLLAASRWGTFKQDRLKEFLKKASLSSEEAMQKFRLHSGKIGKLTQVRSHLREEKAPVSVPTHKCPACGVEFTEAKKQKRVKLTAPKL